MLEDLRGFINAAEKLSLVKKIENANCEEEIGAIADMLGNDANPPLLLYDKIKGYPEGFRIAANCTISPKLCAIALGLDASQSNIGIMKEYRKRVENLKPISPKVVNSGPVNENVMSGDQVDLMKFPAAKWHLMDGGKYFGTSSLIITKDPESDWVNIGNYRIMLHNKNTLGVWFTTTTRHGRVMSEKYWKKGKNGPVAVSFGHDVGTWLTSIRSLPPGVSEYDYAGGFRGEPVNVILGELTGLPIPATSEIAIEGEIPPPDTESIMEGPFCEYPGYYSHHAPETIIKVKRVIYRNNPIMLAAPIPKPPHNTVGLPYLGADLWDYLDRAGIPASGVWVYGASLLVVIAIRQQFAGHAKQALLSAGAFTGTGPRRFVVTVDDDIDPSNLDDVIWAIVTRADPADAMDIVRDAWSTSLDPVISPAKRKIGKFSTGLCLLNACRPYEYRNEFPEFKTRDPKVEERVRTTWPDLFKK